MFSAPSASARRQEDRLMDFVYLLALLALYAVTHGLAWALERLGRST